MADACTFTHAVPLDNKVVFETAYACPMWKFGDVLPSACDWSPISHFKADDVVACNNMRPGGHIYFNFGTNSALAMRKYIHKGERDGIYHFTSARYRDIIVREASTFAVNIVIKGRTIQAIGLGGNIVYELGADVSETIRVYEFRKQLQNNLVMNNKVTKTNMVKCMFPSSTTILRGNLILVRASAPVRRAAPRRGLQYAMRERGQGVISKYFKS